MDSLSVISKGHGTCLSSVDSLLCALEALVLVLSNADCVALFRHKHTPFRKQGKTARLDPEIDSAVPLW